MQDQVRGGSNSLFVLLKILNIITLGSGITLLSLSIWLWIVLSVYHPIHIILIIIATIQCMSVFLGWSARNSIKRLLIYNIILFVELIVQLLSIILGVILKAQIIESILSKTHQYQKQHTYRRMFDIIMYYLGGNELLIIVLLIVTYYYLRSVRDINFQQDYLKIQQTGTKILVQQKYDPQSGRLKYKQNQLHVTQNQNVV